MFSKSETPLNELKRRKAGWLPLLTSTCLRRFPAFTFCGIIFVFSAKKEQTNRSAKENQDLSNLRSTFPPECGSFESFVFKAKQRQNTRQNWADICVSVTKLTLYVKGMTICLWNFALLEKSYSSTDNNCGKLFPSQKTLQNEALGSRERVYMAHFQTGLSLVLKINFFSTLIGWTQAIRNAVQKIIDVIWVRGKYHCSIDQSQLSPCKGS